MSETTEREGDGGIGSSKLLCGVELIRGERIRQVEREGWSLGHDQSHDGSQIAEAARCCLQSYVNGVGGYAPMRHDDKWGLGRKHNANPERLLIIAGALIAAELDRIRNLPKLPTEDPHYQKHVEELAKQCTCTPASEKPCDGLLAGGLCDDLHLDEHPDA